MTEGQAGAAGEREGNTPGFENFTPPSPLGRPSLPNFLSARVPTYKVELSNK